MIEMSADLDKIASALHAAQGSSDPANEMRALRIAFPVVTPPGRGEQSKSIHERLLARVRWGLSGCWHWCGSANGFGYGRITYQGRLQTAHRLAYEAFVGPIPDGLSVLHRCDNPGCINPDHLWIGTYSDNRRDCQRKGRWKMHNPRRGFEHQNNSVSIENLCNMRHLRSQGFSYAKIGVEVGLSAMTVWHALNKRFGGVQ